MTNNQIDLSKKKEKKKDNTHIDICSSFAWASQTQKQNYWLLEVKERLI